VAQTLRTSAGITFSGATAGTETVTIGTDVYSLPALGSAAAAATWLAEQINSDPSLAYYAFDDGAGNLTLYSEGGAFDLAATGGIAVDDDTTLNEVIAAINNGATATGSINLNLGAMVGGETVTVDGNTWTYGVDFNTVPQLQALIDGLGNVSTTTQGNNIFITATAAGTDGNAIALSTSDATNVVINNATLSNGLDGTNDPTNPTNVVASAMAAVGGVSLNLAHLDTGATATVTPGNSTLGASMGLDFNTYTQLATASDGGTADNGGEIDLTFDFDIIDPDTGTVTTLNQQVTLDYNISSEDEPPEEVTYIDPITGDEVTTTPYWAYAGSTMSAGGYDTFLLEQDGRPNGYLTNITVDDYGVIHGIYSNGHEQALAAVALTDFMSPEELQRWGDTLWAATEAAGEPQLGQAGDPELALGTIESFALETSTVDVAQEMVNLINYQRSFQANGKSITTSDEMLKTAINMKT
jgi:flagellar hook protein FlgE